MVAAQPRRARALQLTCGDLVLAFSVSEVDRVSLTTDLELRSLAPHLFAVKLAEEDEPIPGWDLAHLLGARKPSTMHTWVIVAAELAGTVRRFALGADRSTSVQAARMDLPLPPRLFSKRPGAVAGAFITGDSEAPSGYTLLASRLLATEELAEVTRQAGLGSISW